MQRKRSTVLLIFGISFALGSAVYIPYIIKTDFFANFGWAQISSIICFAMFFALLACFILKLFGYWFDKDSDSTLNSRHKKPDILTLHDKKSRRLAWLKICLFILTVKSATYIIGYITATSAGYVSGGFFETFDSLWCTTGIDAPSYLGIAQNWYQTSGDAMYHLVFFPLYPIIVKAFQLVIGNYLVAGILVSTLSSFGIGIAGYELIRFDYDEKTAFRFVKYTFLLPAAFFYCTPMTEALFVFLCLLCLLYTKKRKFYLAAIFGALAAFTRSAGVLLIIPMGIEYIRILIETRRDESQRKLFTARLIGLGALVLSVSAGLFLYLLINYSLWGNPLKFTVFQREHWDQGIGYFFNTAKYEATGFMKALNAFFVNPTDTSNLSKAISLFGSNLVFIHGALLAVLIASKKLRAHYTGYFMAYYAFSIGVTWLLSAPRYLMASIALPLAFAVLSDTRRKDIIWTLVLSVLSFGFIILFVTGAYIY